MSGTKVDLDTLRAAIKDYTSIVEELRDAQQVGRALINVMPPGQDTPGKVYNGSAGVVGHMHFEANQNLQEVLITRIQNLEATLRQYEHTEQGNQANLKPKD